jgi:hypothetical protein
MGEPWAVVCRCTLRNRRSRVWACAVFVWAVTGLVFAGYVSAIAPLPPPPQAVAVVGRGAVWFDDGPVFFKGFHSGSVRLGPIETKEIGRESSVASSASAVAAIAGEGAGKDVAFVGDVPPSPLVVVAPPRLMGGGGCKGWLPGGDFVVAGDDLVVAGECQWDDYSVRQPLYIRSLRGGRWRVLRWLTVVSLPGGDGVYDNVPPVLAAEGDLVAVGVQFSSVRMAVSILDVRDGRRVARFDLPDGYMAFASRDRLVLSVPVLPSPEDHDFPLSSDNLYRLALYSTRGQHIAELGSAQEPPLVSGMHLLTEEDGTVSVRSVAGGAPKAVIGFNPPGRALITLAFRWPVLVMVETTSVPLLSSEVHCWSGDYGPASKPFLGVFDLARSEPFVSAPAPAHLELSEPVTGCGPAPP